MARDKITQLKPDPRFVLLMNFALNSVVPKLDRDGRYEPWLIWAQSWKSGERSPQACVDVAHRCFAYEGDPVWHTLGQLCWGAKECCYPDAGWLVIRYIADAMIAFGVAFPDPAHLTTPTLTLEYEEVR